MKALFRYWDGSRLMQLEVDGGPELERTQWRVKPAHGWGPGAGDDPAAGKQQGILNAAAVSILNAEGEPPVPFILGQAQPSLEVL